MKGTGVTRVMIGITGLSLALLPLCSFVALFIMKWNESMKQSKERNKEPSSLTFLSLSFTLKSRFTLFIVF